MLDPRAPRATTRESWFASRKTLRRITVKSGCSSVGQRTSAAGDKLPLTLEALMRQLLILALVAVTALTASSPVGAQATGRMNPIIALQEKGLPVFGIAHPPIAPRGAGRGRGAAPTDPAAPPPPPPPAIVLSDVAKETVAYTRADYLFTSGTSDTFLRYIEEITKAGGSMRTHPFAAKIGIWHSNPENVNAAIVRQLNAGHSSVSMEAVESDRKSTRL